MAGVVLLLLSPLPHILRITRCEGQVRGLFGLVGQGLTKIAARVASLPMKRTILQYCTGTLYN
eukprot:1136251-Pelagomonas_calceolata.AAC.1